MKFYNFELKPSTVSVALSLVFLAGCMPSKQLDAWQADKELVVQSLQDAHTSNAKLQSNFEALDRRIIFLETMQAKQDSKIKSLEETLVKRAKASKLEKKKKINKNKAKILNDKLDTLSAKLNPTVVKPIEANASMLAEKNAYTAAYLALKSSRYDESSYGFSAVIQAHPEGVYTDQAYYWLGESLVAQHRNKEAIEAFKLVANKYKTSPKHAAALLKMASVYQGMKDIAAAKAALKRVIQEHPDSRSAERARIQLDNLSKTKGVKQ